MDLSAVRKGMPDIAVGDLLGSSLMNLLILGVADMLHRNPQKMFSRSASQHTLSAAMSINVTAVAILAIFLGPELSDARIGEVGLGPMAVGLCYLLGLRLIYFEQRTISYAAPKNCAQLKRTALTSALSVYLLSALAIFIAAPFVAESAAEIADHSGLGRTFIGSSLVAFSTSLPKVASTLAAVCMGAFDLAIGNIFGSNSFNMILILPLDYLHPGNLLGDVSRNHMLTGIAVILATSVAIMGQLYHEEKRKMLIEPDAAAVIAIVILALYGLYWTSGG